jgi:hypothetical protein
MKLLHLDFDIEPTRKMQFRAEHNNLMSRPSDRGFYIINSDDRMISPFTDQLRAMTADNWTVDFWFYYESLPGEYDSMFFYGYYPRSSGNYFTMYWYRSESKLSVYMNTYNIGSFTFRTASASPFSAGWNHVALVRNHDDGEYYIYLNGTKRGTHVTPVTPPSAPLGFTIAGHPSSDYSPYSYPFSNYMGPFRVSSIARWTGESFTPPSIDMVPDDDTVMLATFPALDKAARHYIYVSDYSAAAPKFMPVGKPGFGQCMYFDYDTDRDSLHTDSSSDFLFTNEFTVEFWVLMQKTTSNQWMWAINDTVLALQYMSATKSVRLYHGDVGTYIDATDRGVPGGKWTHIAVTRNSANLCRVAVDGVHSAVTATVAGDMGSANVGFSLAARLPNSVDATAAMYVHDVAVWNENRYPADFTPPTEPLP